MLDLEWIHPDGNSAASGSFLGEPLIYQKGG